MAWQSLVAAPVEPECQGMMAGEGRKPSPGSLSVRGVHLTSCVWGQRPDTLPCLPTTCPSNEALGLRSASHMALCWQALVLSMSTLGSDVLPRTKMRLPLCCLCAHSGQLSCHGLKCADHCVDHMVMSMGWTTLVVATPCMLRATLVVAVYWGPWHGILGVAALSMLPLADQLEAQ